jgi:hypothetical protein
MEGMRMWTGLIWLIRIENSGELLWTR